MSVLDSPQLVSSMLLLAALLSVIGLGSSFSQVRRKYYSEAVALQYRFYLVIGLYSAAALGPVLRFSGAGAARPPVCTRPWNRLHSSFQRGCY